MADYIITAATVVSSGEVNGAQFVTKIAAATITAGQSLYKLADDTVGLFICNGTALQRVFFGLASNGASTGQPVTVCLSDPSWTFGVAIAAGQMVIGSATAGGIAPVADKATGWYVTPIGCGISSNKIQLYPVGNLQATAAAV